MVARAIFGIAKKVFVTVKSDVPVINSVKFGKNLKKKRDSDIVWMNDRWIYKEIN